jgi:excisionase family DNA binding protein
MSIHDTRKQQRNRAVDLEPLAVSPAEACRLLSIGNTRLYQLIGSAELESYRDGRARRITMRSIRARMARLLAAGRGTPAEAEQ